MSLPWVRLDTAFPMNQKLLHMLKCKDGHRAAFVYLCALAVSGQQGSDGFISRRRTTTAPAARPTPSYSSSSDSGCPAQADG